MSSGAAASHARSCREASGERRREEEVALLADFLLLLGGHLRNEVCGVLSTTDPRNELCGVLRTTVSINYVFDSNETVLKQIGIRIAIILAAPRESKRTLARTSLSLARNLAPKEKSLAPP